MNVYRTCCHGSASTTLATAKCRYLLTLNASAHTPDRKTNYGVLRY
jgi:hypothetical protein